MVLGTITLHKRASIKETWVYGTRYTQAMAHAATAAAIPARQCPTALLALVYACVRKPVQDGLVQALRVAEGYERAHRVVCVTEGCDSYVRMCEVRCMSV